MTTTRVTLQWWEVLDLIVYVYVIYLPLDFVSHLDGAQEALVARLGSRREEGEVGPLQSQVLGHVLVHHGVGLAAVEHVLEVMPMQGFPKKVVLGCEIPM